MLETEIKKLTDAVIANTAARTGQAVAATQEVPTAAAKPAQASPAAAAPVVDVLSEAPAAIPPAAAPPAAAGIEAAAVAAPAAVFTKEQVVKAVVKLAKLSGREVAVTLMSTFGAKKASELNDVEKYPAIMTAISAALPSDAAIVSAANEIGI